MTPGASQRQQPSPAAAAGSSTVPASPFSWLTGNAYLLLALASLTWSGNHIIGRAFVGTDVPPMFVALMRWVLPLPLLWWLARPHLAADWPVLRQHWRVMAFLAVVGWAVFAALMYKALELTDALNVSVMNSLAPVLILAAGALMFGDRLSWLQASGIAVSLAGVIVIIARGNFATLAAFAFNWGDIAIFINMGFWAVYSASLRLRPKAHWLSLTFTFTVLAAIMTLPAAAIEMAMGAVVRPTFGAVATCLYVAFLAGFVGMVTWNRGVELVGAARAGAFLHLIPIFSAVLSWLVLGEPLQAFHLAGFALILAGVGLATRR